MVEGVTIIVPVYNEVDRVEQAVRSAVSQCERLLIADNCSTDGTEVVCERLAKELPYTTFYRHSENLGQIKNWHFLLERVQTPFVMLLGSHDEVGPGYVTHLKKALDEDPSLMVAMGELHMGRSPIYEPVNKFNEWTGGNIEHKMQRLEACLFDRSMQVWSAYGLYRTAVVKRAILEHDNPVYAIDHTMLVRVAMEGRIKIFPGVRYLAWDAEHGGETRSTSHVQRLLGDSEERKRVADLKRKYRSNLFDLYAHAMGVKTGVRRFASRYRFMVRMGTYVADRPDWVGIVQWVPAKIHRRILRRKI